MTAGSEAENGTVQATPSENWPPMARGTSLAGIARLLGWSTALPVLTALMGFLWWPLELTTHFHGWWGVGALAAASALALLRPAPRRQILTLAVLGLVDLAFLAPFWLGKGPADGPHDLRLFVANVHTANSGSANALLETIQSESPDIVALMEVDAGWLTRLAALDAEYPHRALAPRRDNFGIAVWSRIACERLEVVTLGKVGVPSIHATIELPGRAPTLLLVTHPIPPSPTRMPDARDDQLAAVARHVAAASTPHRIVAGDLNTTPWTRSFTALCRAAGVHDTRPGFGYLPTWPARLAPLGVAIDHVLTSTSVEIIDLRLGPANGSDHRPMIADVRLPE